MPLLFGRAAVIRRYAGATVSVRQSSIRRPLALADAQGGAGGIVFPTTWSRAFLRRSFSDTGLDLEEERARYVDYQAYFQIQSEVG